jgi:metal transporter CNNM
VSTFFVILTVLALIVVSGICSGLNVSLMALNIDDLRRKRKLGNPRARKVYYFRENTHLTLAAILLTNVAAVSATSLVLESVLIGVVAGLITTLLMVIFGEILPQAVFSRHALKYFALFSPIVRLMIFVTYPISKPLQWLLDRLFEQPPAHLHNRRELGIIISEHIGHEGSDLDEDEVEIIRGALQLSEKQVSDIMRPLETVYWLKLNTELTPERIDEIKKYGRSRIPIFNQNLTRCNGILLMKDMVDIDFGNNHVFVSDIDLHPVQMIGSRTALDTLLRKFINSGTHLFPVIKDDHIIGIVTIEDLIEEIVGQEIEDETDKRQALGNA